MAKPVLTADALGKWGSVPSHSVREDRVVHALALRGQNVSKSHVAEQVRNAEAQHRQNLYRAISGRKDSDISGKGTDPEAMLQAAYGRGPRGGAVNTKAAAKSLGVSASTIRRWISGSRSPSPEHLKALQTASRQAASTKAGRRAATADFRASAQGQKALAGASRIWVKGNQGVGGRDSDKYTRTRDAAQPVDPEDVEAMLAAYEEGGADALHEWMCDIMDRYVPDWGFISIDDFGFGDPQ